MSDATTNFDEVAHLKAVAASRATDCGLGSGWLEKIVLLEGGTWRTLDSRAEHRLRQTVELLGRVLDAGMVSWLHGDDEDARGTSLAQTLTKVPRSLRLALAELREGSVR